jgi:acetyl-CoA carboxylase carboxyltransferase component
VWKAYDPRLIFAWPSAELAVMGGTQAKVLAQIEALSQKEKSLMKPKKLNYSQKKKRDTTNRFHLIMPHQDYGQMLLLIR